MDPWLSWRFEELPAADVHVVLAGMACAGLLYCFVGYRLFKLVLALTGFMVAGGAAAALVGWLSHGHMVAMLIALALGGCCGALALLFAYRAGVFFVGSLAGLIAALNFLHGRAEAWIPLAILGLALAGGLVALWLERPAMTMATAAIGAWLLTCAGVFLATGVQSSQEPSITGTAPAWMAWAALGAWLTLTLLGSAFQLRTSRKETKKR